MRKCLRRPAFSGLPRPRKLMSLAPPQAAGLVHCAAQPLQDANARAGLHFGSVWQKICRKHHSAVRGGTLRGFSTGSNRGLRPCFLLQTYLQCPQQHLRMAARLLCQLLQHTGKVARVFRVPAIKLRRALLLAVGLPQRFVQTADARRFRLVGAGLLPGLNVIHRLNAARVAALFLRQPHQCLAHAAARHVGERPIRTRGAQLRCIKLHQRFRVQNGDVARALLVFALCKPRAGRLHAHYATPYALLLFWVHRFHGVCLLSVHFMPPECRAFTAAIFVQFSQENVTIRLVIEKEMC